MAKRQACFRLAPLDAGLSCRENDGIKGGFALVSVLLFLTLAATIVTPFILDARTERMVQSGLYRTKQLDLLADGLTDLVAAQILSGQSRQEKSAIPLNAEGVSCAAGRLTIALHIQPVGSTSMPPRRH